MKSSVSNPATVTVHVPMTFAIRGGRKQIISESGQATDTTAVMAAPRRAPYRTENALLKALARAHRWKAMLESGEYASLTELAKSEKINLSYLCRMLRLTLLAPQIVEALLDGKHPDVQLSELLRPVSLIWTEQRNKLTDIGNAVVSD